VIWVNERAQKAFDRMKKDPHSVSLQEILLIADGFKEDLKRILEGRT